VSTGRGTGRKAIEQQLLQRHYAAWSSGDVNGILACFAADASLEDVALEATFAGHDEIRQMAVRVLAAMPDLQWTPTRICVDGSTVFTEWRMTGTHADDLPRIGPGTGKQFSVRGSSVDEIRDGLIHRHRDYWNLTTYQRQVGLLP
jgi:steroid delta-isomerase-like uncharacterized protein